MQCIERATKEDEPIRNYNTGLSQNKQSPEPLTLTAFILAISRLGLILMYPHPALNKRKIIRKNT